jgi:hypothetical protein
VSRTSGVAVGKIVAIAIRVEEQVRHLQHEDASVPEGKSRGQVQPIDEILTAVHAAIAVGVLQDRDPVGPAWPMRWRLGDPVVLGPREPVDLHPLESLGVGVLQILNDPQTAAIIKLNRDGLTDQRLSCDEADLKTRMRLHLSQRFFRRMPLRQNKPREDLKCHQRQQPGPVGQHQSHLRGARRIKVVRQARMSVITCPLSMSRRFRPGISSRLLSSPSK